MNNKNKKVKPKSDVEFNNEKSAHKCNGCWCGRWLGYKLFCMMPNCIKAGDHIELCRAD